MFCRVIDNLGDAGVCWRLARQMATEHGRRVTLYIDAPAVLARLLPAGAPADDLLAGRPALVDGVSIHPWPAEPSEPSEPNGGGPPGDPGDAGPHGPIAESGHPATRWQPALAADLLIAAFGCELPTPVRANLGRDRADPDTCSSGTPPRSSAGRSSAGGERRPPQWINLEYLSAEPWIDGANWMPSIKPSDGAVEHFVFPGFSAASAGLLRERGLLARRDAFRAAAEDRAWLRRHRIDPSAGEPLVSLFTYDSADLPGRLAALAGGPQPLRMLVPAGVATRAMTLLCGAPPAPGERRTISALTVHGLPWLEQDDYDRLLWSCDLNLVRGEDSWIRAHWAGRPMAWQPYPQADGAHLRKLDAWLARLLAGTDVSLAAPIGDFLRAWAGAWPDTDVPTAAGPETAGAADAALAAAWAAFAPLLHPGHQGYRVFERFARSLAGCPDLTSSLLAFADRQTRLPTTHPQR